ncbi:glycosyltransferase family 4 protein [Schleiferiaceae bacterium]|nr:glycosyltransferase family 4 protein [Schleiferiaceae bacterium]
MRILHISSDYCWTKVYPNIVSNLIDCSVDQTIYIPTRSALEEGKNQVPGAVFIYSHVLRIWMKLFFFLKIKSISKDLSEKVVFDDVKLMHTHFLFTDGGAAYHIKKKYGIKYITTVRNTDVNLYFKYFVHARSYALKVMRNSEAIIFLSPAYRDHVFSKYIPNKLHKTLGDKCFVIPNGIDSYWHSNILKKPKTLGKVVRFVCVCELSKNKNIHKTIGIVKEFRKIQECQLTIIGGSGDYSAKILKLVNENKDFVSYEGEVRDKNELLKYLRSSSLFIMPSEYESFGLVYIEAMSQGLPCIYTRGQGIDGYFRPGKIGYPVNPDDIDDTKNIILEILSNYETISENALLAVQNFEWMKIVKKYIEIYKEL